MPDSSVAGLPMRWEDGENNQIFPMAALVVLKGVDMDGDEVYLVTNSEGLKSVDALGMAHFAVLTIEDEVRKIVVSAEEE